MGCILDKEQLKISMKRLKGQQIVFSNQVRVLVTENRFPHSLCFIHRYNVYWIVVYFIERLDASLFREEIWERSVIIFLVFTQIQILKIILSPLS